MDELTGPNPQITTRIDRDLYDRAARIAEELYDGNMAMLARIAIKRYVAANYPLVVRTIDAGAEVDALSLAS